MFASAAYDTVPFPEPLEPLFMWSHPALFEEAVQVQPAVVETLTEPEPPEAACDREVGLIE